MKSEVSKKRKANARDELFAFILIGACCPHKETRRSRSAPVLEVGFSNIYCEYDIQRTVHRDIFL